MFATLATLALVPAALGQMTHQVSVGATVGDSNLRYDPQFINAAKGDTVVFTFNPKNHTVTQSSFAQPCVALPGGADSSFHPVSNVSALLPTWTFAVSDDTQPFWFYCQQTGHCGQGMVFAINPPTTNHTFDAFQALAIQLNGTSTGSASSAASSSDATFTPPPPQSWASATATMTHDGSTWTTIYTSYDGTPSPTYAPSPVDHKIQVGVNGLNFTPPSISASIGDTVTFEFHAKNHTVTQSTFNDPCTFKDGGFDSGFNFPVGVNDTTFPTFQITINDTAPIWGYCRQVIPTGGTHCHSGMVFAINAVESGQNNFENFLEIATGSFVGAINTNSASASGSGPTTSTSSAAVGAQRLASPAHAYAVVVGLFGLLAGVLIV